MPTQQEIDLKPIKSRFPNSNMDSDGLPTIISKLKDPEGTIPYLEEETLGLQIDIEDGFRVTIDTYHLPFLSLDLDQLERITNRARVAQDLLNDWKETPTGKAWLAKEKD